MQALKVAIVILSYNSRKLFEALLPLHLERTPLSDEVGFVIVDNASSDDTVAYVKTHFPEIPLIEFDENYGFAGGYQKALSQIEAEYYILLSADVEVAEGWLPPIVELLDSDQNIGACQPKVRSYHKRELLEYAGGAGGYIDAWGYPFGRGRVFDTLEKDEGQYDSVQEIFWASGCSIVVRASAYHEVGGLAVFFAHQEEIDLCWRMQRAGYKVMACPQAVVYHMGGYSLDYQSPFKLYLNARNNLILLVRNLPAGTLLWLIPWRLLVDSVANLYILFKSGPGASWALVKAQWHFILGLPKWLKGRQKLKGFYPLSVLKGTYPHSIIIDYFLLGRKTFHRLRGIRE